MRAAVVRDGAVLMNRYVMGGAEVYDLPGGGQDHGEEQDAALVRECLEETGARVVPGPLAFCYELMTDHGLRTGEEIGAFHQLNVVRWCTLAPGEEPGVGTAPDGHQEGTAWLPLDRLDAFDVRPVEVARWLAADQRPGWIGTIRFRPAG